MILSDTELRELYVGLVKPFQHPDPLGYMTRVLLLSEGDPDFVEGRERGFLPVDMTYAIEETGVPETQSLENNITATLALDRINFDRYGSVDDMVIATHYEGIVDPDNYTAEQTDFLNAIEEARVEVLSILEPPLATVDDVIDLLNLNREGVGVTKKQEDFFCFLLDNRV